MLLLGKLPHLELSKFDDLAGQRKMPDSLIGVVESIPASAHPMEVIRTIISYMGVIEPELSFDDQLGVAKRLIE